MYSKLCLVRVTQISGSLLEATSHQSLCGTGSIIRGDRVENAIVLVKHVKLSDQRK